MLDLSRMPNENGTTFVYFKLNQLSSCIALKKLSRTVFLLLLMLAIARRKYDDIDRFLLTQNTKHLIVS